MTEFLLTCIFITIWMDIAAIYHLIKSDMFTKAQTGMQSVLILLFPIVAAFLIIRLIHSHKQYKKTVSVHSGASSAILRVLTLSFLADSYGGGFIPAPGESFDSHEGDGGDASGGDG